MSDDERCADCGSDEVDCYREADMTPLCSDCADARLAKLLTLICGDEELARKAVDEQGGYDGR